MHHAAKDWADGGLTDIDQLVPACDVHNRRVGTKPGQFTTRMITEGPDTGRVAWRLNAKPGMPANPERINRIADVKADFHDYLAAEHISNEAAAAARTTGTGIAIDTAVAAIVPPPLVSNPPAGRVELALADGMPSADTRRLSRRVDIRWNLANPPDPDPPTDPDAPTGPAPPGGLIAPHGVDPPDGLDPPLADAA